jgi:chromosome segregation ATPase
VYIVKQSTTKCYFLFFFVFFCFFLIFAFDCWNSVKKNQLLYRSTFHPTTPTMPQGQTNVVTESELEDLRQKFHLLEGDRKAYYEMSMHTMKSNKVLVSQLRDQNKSLRRALASIQRETRSASSAGMTTDQQEMSELARQVTHLRRQHDKVISKVDVRSLELSTLRDKSGELQAEGTQPLTEDTPTTRRIRMLENRLDKAMIKYNEAQSIRKTYEQIVKRLKEERVGFDNQLMALERTLAAKEHDFQELLLLSTDAQHARDVTQQELERVRNTYQSAKRARERDVRERQEIVQIRTEVTNRMQQREQAREDIIDATVGDVAQKDDAALAAEQRARGVLNGEDDEALQAEQAQAVFEEAFEKIKEATGVSDIQEVIHKIVNQEDTQNNLMSLTKENQGKIEGLRGQLEVASARVDEIKYSGTGVTQKRKLVDDHEANLTAASAKLERSKLKSERMAAVLINVKAGIEHITDRIEAYRDDQQQLLQITDETVVEVLYQCESTVERLLAEAKSRTASSDDSNEVSSSIFNKNKDSIDLAQSVTDRQVMETRPFNQRVTLPTGDRNLDSIAEDDRDDDGGQDSVTDGDELTRDKIKKASGAFTTQHDRAQRKKERKKGKKKR